MESDIGDESVAKGKAKARDTPASVIITSHRTHACDVDNISAKAVIDGIVKAGILKDDGPRYVKEVAYRFEKVKDVSEEKTIVEIIWGN